MSDILNWLEAHDRLAGWAQVAGAVLALAATYITAFAPTWRRKQQLREAGKRLLAHGHEVVESYHRSLSHFAPFPESLELASLTFAAVIDEINRFPVFEIDEQVGPLSLPRRLMSMRMLLSVAKLHLDATAKDIEERTVTPAEYEALKAIIKERLDFAEALVANQPMTRPEWPADEAG